MAFNTAGFLFLFFPAAFLLYRLMPGRRTKNVFLAIASALFYGFGGLASLPVLLAAFLWDYLIAKDEKRAKLWCGIAAAGNLALLGFYKYLAFVLETLHLPALSQPFALPLGISFFTFHGISYLVDVYREPSRVCRRADTLFLYLAFFPRLIAGPIVRWQDAAAQLAEHPISPEMTAAGLRRLVRGLLKKLLLAESAAAVANAVYALAPEQLGMGLAWLGAVSYCFQIFFDFSGYSDMAIGLGRMFGFHFLENFNYPYVSRSVTEFWRRWHISLSTWFRDYVYIPLGGNRCSRARNILNLFLVWALTGLWHGANWTFIAWGLWFFVLLIGEKFLWGKALSRLPSLLQHVYAMLLVILSWVLFRADDIDAALCYMAAMFGRAPALCDSRAVYYALEFWPELLLCCIAALPVKNLLETALEKRNSKLSRGLLIVGPKLASLALLALSYCRLVTGSFNPFIYFRF